MGLGYLTVRGQREAESAKTKFLAPLTERMARLLPKQFSEGQVRMERGLFIFGETELEVMVRTCPCRKGQTCRWRLTHYGPEDTVHQDGFSSAHAFCPGVSLTQAISYVN